MSKHARPESLAAIPVGIRPRIQWAPELVEPNRTTFAKLMGVDPSTIAKIETGERPPSVFNVLEIAHRLRVSTDYILTGSLRGVDGELAALLAAAHPELAAYQTAPAAILDR